ncbi:hypothetical protein [Spongiactinospora sp. TRM90649]|uniref:hypothetical protein n=1 Tax=Spongiactinospora sp. TRM90649 TaxID=3031114 RepID=UPI0023F72175|nr:hypothetical protein [Spongiactinospora sp. TRM90649]MDF5754746.1 hypothetical protein [Spongiactinospora sp. TRM90649]
MGGLRCADGSYLTVLPRACVDSVGVPYEITLELRRDGAPYGMVGERCGWLLPRLAAGMRAARADGDGAWADPDDRFPEDAPDAELFAFRYRSRRRVVGGGELRCQVRTLPLWTPADAPAAIGRWRLTRRAVVEAWGHDGVGLRAVLTSGELAEFIAGLVVEAEGCLGMAQSGSGIRNGGTDRPPGR